MMPEPDEITILAHQVYAYLARYPFREHPPDLTFIFQLVGLEIGSQKSRDVYERILLRLEIEADYRQKREATQQPQANGKPP